MAARHCFAIFIAALLIVSGCDTAKVANNGDSGGASAASTAGESTGGSDAKAVSDAKAAPVLADFPELKVTPSGNEGTSVGDTAPDIAGTDSDGKEFKLSEYRGKLVMLDFWGDW